jgi:hypothetical protein
MLLGWRVDKEMAEPLVAGLAVHWPTSPKRRKYPNL